VIDNDHFLTVFLAARNNRPDVAFEIVSISKTSIRNLPSSKQQELKINIFLQIKGYLNVKYVEFPEIFDLPVSAVRNVLESGCVGILKARDSLGRRVIVARIGKLVQNEL
jgi:hypothetical protein